MHAFDRAVCRRSVVITLVLALLTLGVMVATDEVGSTPRMRLARLIAIVPGLIALGEGIVLAQCRARGELVALSALGASPWRIGRGARIAGWALGAIGVLLLLSPLTDPAPLFPAVVRSTPWIPTLGALADPATGVRVVSDGSIAFDALMSEAELSYAPGRVAALSSIVPIALVTPAWASCPLGVAARLGAAFVALVLTIVTLHAVAAEELPTLGLIVAPLPLLLQAAWSLYKTRTA